MSRKALYKNRSFYYFLVKYKEMTHPFFTAKMVMKEKLISGSNQDLIRWVT